jgi:2-iminobutanoate/2-iminopropanoate deaminase
MLFAQTRRKTLRTGRSADLRRYGQPVPPMDSASIQSEPHSKEAEMKMLLALMTVVGLLTCTSFSQQQMKAPLEVVLTKDAPQPVGPYSQAIKAGGLIFASGQIAIDPATGKLIDGDIKAQTERVMKNLSAVLAGAGSNMNRVVKTTVLLKNIADFAAMNEVYGQFFTSTPPSRTTLQAAGLPKDALVEIDLVALP